MKVQRAMRQKTTNGSQRDGGGESTQQIIFEIAMKKPNAVCSFLKVLSSPSSMNMLCAISIASLSQLTKFTFANSSIKMELTKRCVWGGRRLCQMWYLNHGMNVSLDTSLVTLYK